MTRLNFILFFALIFSALGLVNSQHQARNLYIKIEQGNETTKLLQQEYGQLQLEQSTQAMHSRIERIATKEMQMQVPDAKLVQVVVPPPAPNAPQAPSTVPPSTVPSSAAVKQ